MPYRRDTVGRLGDLADLLLKSHLQRKSQEHESQLVADRQKEQAQFASDLSEFQRVMNDPTEGGLATRLARSGRTKIGIHDITPYMATPGQAVENVGKQIAGAPDLGRVPTPADIQNSYESQPGYQPYTPSLDPNTSGPRVDPNIVPIDRLMAQRKAKEQAFKDALPPTLRTRINARGPEPFTEQYQAQPFDVMPPERTSLTGSEEGKKEGLKQLATEQTPGLPEAKATALNLVEGMTRPGAMARASGIAGGQAKATFPYQKQLAEIHADLTAENRPISQQGKTALISLNEMTKMGPHILEKLKAKYPGIDKNPEQYGGTGATLEAKKNKALYSFGLYQPDEDILQLEQLFKVIAARPYMLGRPNIKMYNDITSHLGDFGFSPGADYDRITKLLALVPDLKSSIEEVETPGYLQRQREATPPGLPTGPDVIRQRGR